jgi:hypothetical protein
VPRVVSLPWRSALRARDSLGHSMPEGAGIVAAARVSETIRDLAGFRGGPAAPARPWWPSGLAEQLLDRQGLHLHGPEQQGDPEGQLDDP